MLGTILISIAVPIGAGFLARAFVSPTAGPVRSASARSGPIIILKLDDIVEFPGAPIHPHWQRITNYLEDSSIKSAMGIICDSLEKAAPSYIQWIKDHHRRALIEFWCHGYHSRTRDEKTGEFENDNAAAQQAILEKCLELAKDKLGIDLPAFGPHWSGTTDATDQALQAVPEIKIWLNGPEEPKFFTRLSIPRVVRLEDPVFVPDFDKFRAAYDLIGAQQSVLVLQGHPVPWDDAGWSGFVKIVEFLQSKNCIFMTPSEYRGSITKNR